jgi:hypothetical protein
MPDEPIRGFLSNDPPPLHRIIRIIPRSLADEQCSLGAQRLPGDALVRSAKSNECLDHGVAVTDQPPGSDCVCRSDWSQLAVNRPAWDYFANQSFGLQRPALSSSALAQRGGSAIVQTAHWHHCSIWLVTHSGDFP